MRIVPDGSRRGVGGRGRKRSSAPSKRTPDTARKRATRRLTRARLRDVLDEISAWDPVLAAQLAAELGIESGM